MRLGRGSASVPPKKNLHISPPDPLCWIWRVASRQRRAKGRGMGKGRKGEGNQKEEDGVEDKWNKGGEGNLTL